MNSNLVKLSDIEFSSLKLKGVCQDSRFISKNWAFFIRGTNLKKHTSFIEDAIKNGCACLIFGEEVSTENIPSTSSPFISTLQDKDSNENSIDFFLTKYQHLIPCFKLSSTNLLKSYAELCASVSNFPSKSLVNIGVTGTNGKTSVAVILTKILRLLGKQATFSGTLGLKGVNDDFSFNTNFSDKRPLLTTPDAGVLQNFFMEQLQQGSNYVCSEVSAHGLSQERTSYIDWDAAIFLNLTQDHLDYFPNLEEYFQAKNKFFVEELSLSTKAKRFAILNLDSEYSSRIIKELKEKNNSINIVTFSSSGNKNADFFITEKSPQINKSCFTVSTNGQFYQFESKLIGDYNFENILASIATVSVLGFEINSLIAAISKMDPTPGRLERLNTKDRNILIDYAHTPDGLENVLKSIRRISNKRVICVFGCGGDRDKVKRPLMGEIAEKFSDIIIITSDNPRTEDPGRIVEEIALGLSSKLKDLTPQVNLLKTATSEEETQHCQLSELKIEFQNSDTKFYLKIPDRRKAIEVAITNSLPEDIIIIAGKGHEDYQEIQGKKYPFSDYLISLNFAKELECEI